MSNKNNM